MNALDTHIKQKVYCNCCKYLSKNPPISLVTCKHPDNYIMFEGNWAQPAHKLSGKSSPADINKNNDCEWYELK